MLYKKGIEIIEIEECTFGFNQSIPAIKISIVNNVTALLPRQKLSEIQIYQNNIIPFQKQEEFWAKVDWFPPVFMNREQIGEGFKVANLKIGYHEFCLKRSYKNVFKSFSRLYIISPTLFPSLYKLFQTQ